MKGIMKKPCKSGTLGKGLSSVIIIMLLLQNSPHIYSQYSVISEGTIFSANGGTITLNTSLVNNGSFINADDEIVFTGADRTIGGTSPVSFANLTIQTGSTTVVNTAGQTVSGILLSNGSLNAGGNITLLSTASGTALIDGSGTGTVTGNITMQRYLPTGFGYKYLSSPFQAAAVAELGEEIDLLAAFSSIYRYDENRTSTGWVSYKNPSGLLNPLEGYSANFGASTLPETAEIEGVVSNGNFEVTLYNHNHPYTKGFNLVGNPYPSPIDWDAPSGWTRDKIDNAVYYFKADSSDQYAGTYSTYIAGMSSDGLADNIIPSMQGFFVHVSDGAWPVTGTLGVNNSVRVTDMASPFLKSAQAETPAFVRFTAGYADDSLSFDPLCIYFDAGATNGFDGQYDALKLFNTDTRVTNFYSFGNDSSRLSINALQLNDSSLFNVRLGLKTNRDGYVIFSIKDITGEFKYNYISITDVVTGLTQDLDNDRYYKVNLPAGNYQQRFFINLSNLKTSVSKTVYDTEWFKIYSAHGVLKAEIDLPQCSNGQLKIYNLAGESLFVQNIREPGYHEFNPAVADGIYLVTFTSGQSRASEKVYIQNR
jgi:hypothetical protein